MASKNLGVRGIRQGFPSGSFIGRLAGGKGRGAPQFLSLTQLSRAIVAGGGINSGSGSGSAASLTAVYDYSAPSTGATITMAANSRRLVINPAGTIATCTVNLPPSPTDGQIVGISTTQTITALTLAAGTGGATLIPSGTTLLTANSGFTMLYRLSSNTWYLSA